MLKHWHFFIPLVLATAACAAPTDARRIVDEFALVEIITSAPAAPSAPVADTIRLYEAGRGEKITRLAFPGTAPRRFVVPFEYQREDDYFVISWGCVDVISVRSTCVQGPHDAGSLLAGELRLDSMRFPGDYQTVWVRTARFSQRAGL
ncbi:MAG: hypothetical protein KF689_14150 [Gemmatimonadaceae bacterium]|nr:hypothetical protein [Gemmatimonadaceae bacterium]MCW5826871.1 hypothetical protein [Gemmatimonadaceae bacterium]